MSNEYSSPSRLLCIGGFDSSGRAGVNADFSVCRDLSQTAQFLITANTIQDDALQPLVCPVSQDSFQQALSLLSGLEFQSLKLGMLWSEKHIEDILVFLGKIEIPLIVLDPVSRSSSGVELCSDIESYYSYQKRVLLPEVDLITPNLPEAAALLKWDEKEVCLNRLEACKEILKLGPRSVLLKGGHLEKEQCEDLFYDGNTQTNIVFPRIKEVSARGTGCRLATALCCYLLKGYSISDAVLSGVRYVRDYIEKVKASN